MIIYDATTESQLGRKSTGEKEFECQCTDLIHRCRCMHGRDVKLSSDLSNRGFKRAGMQGN